MSKQDRAAIYLRASEDPVQLQRYHAAHGRGLPPTTGPGGLVCAGCGRRRRSMSGLFSHYIRKHKDIGGIETDG